jgi:hypothetical protein
MLGLNSVTNFPPPPSGTAVQIQRAVVHRRSHNVGDTWTNEYETQAEWHRKGWYRLEGRRDSVVGITTTLRAGRSGDRIPVGARFSAPVQTGSEAHQASYTKETRSLPVVKRPELGVDQPPPSSAEVKERVKLFLHSPSGPSWAVLGLTSPLSFYRLEGRHDISEHCTVGSRFTTGLCSRILGFKSNRRKTSTI